MAKVDGISGKSSRILFVKCAFYSKSFITEEKQSYNNKEEMLLRPQTAPSRA